MNLFEWSPQLPAKVIDLQRPGAALQLSEQYSPGRVGVLASIVAHAIKLGAGMAVIEYRYIDRDYRSENSQFYSKSFRRYPSVTHRIHFFAGRPPPELYREDVAMSFEGLDYLGFSVLRPVVGARVGRTMLRPESHLSDYVSCVADEQVSIFGSEYTVRAAPFMAQDAQFSVCAHTAAWLTAYYHHLKFGAQRLVPADIVAAVPSEEGGLGRPTPSGGLLFSQLAAVMQRTGLPPLVYPIDELDDESIESIACRYLNSGFPVIVAAAEHSFVLVGYRRVYRSLRGARIQFIRQDDEVGVYQLVENPGTDIYHPWSHLIVPLPEKLYTPGERAEAVGADRLRRELATRKDDAAARELYADIRSGKVKFRSTAVLSNRFKRDLADRGMPADVATQYRRLQMPRWIWVIEAVSRRERDRGQPCVLAEAIIDSTDEARDRRVLVWRVPGLLRHWDPDYDLVGDYEVTEKVPPLKSVMQVSGKLT